MTHSLLERQLRKAMDSSGAVDQAALAKLVSITYEEFERSLRLQDRATQLMSDELNEMNANIRKERDQAVAEQQKRFELAVEGTNDGIWDWNVAEDALWLSPRCKTMLGHKNDDLKDCHIENWYGLVSEQDQPQARKLIEEHLKWRMRGSATLRFNHAAGGTRHIMYRATTLQDSFGRVARIVGVHTDITDLIVMQEELKSAKDRAERANKAKSEFLANMSHELRTPMHAILGFSRLALKRVDADKDEKLAAMLGNIGISANRLLGLLNDLLDLSKLESGRTSFEFKKGDVKNAVQQTVQEIEPLFSTSQIRLRIEQKVADTHINYDHKFMVQVFVNLLSNAIKFSPAASEITLTLSQSTHQEKTALLCSIADEGIGIPPEELETVFDKFTQSSKTRSGAGGTGLGLAIVREIVEAHGGKIWAENLSYRGACFNVLLPYEHPFHYPDIA